MNNAGLTSLRYNTSSSYLAFDKREEAVVGINQLHK